MSKKILAAALAVAMVLGLASVAFAFSDTAATANEKAIAKLAALKILDGYPDGTFKPANPITRAEFSKVIVAALGYTSSANLLKTNPVFPDCGNAEWAWGYINVAAAQGIVKGYTDGTFGPNKDVTIAEAITMIVRALGMDAKAVGTWPTGHIMVASEVGMLPNDLPAVNVSATRAIVAQLVANVLGTEFQYKDSNGLWQPRVGVSFLSRNSSSAVPSVTVTKVSVSDMTLTAGATYDILDGVQFVGADALGGFAGQKVDLLLNASGDVIYIGSVDTSALAGKVTAVSKLDKTITINGVVYTVKDTANVEINDLAVYGDAVAKISNLTGAEVDIVLDASGKVTSIIGTKLGTAETINGKVTRYEATGTVNYLTLSSSGEKAVASGARILRNGTAVTYADLQIGDSIRFALTATKLSYIDAYRMEVKGILQEKSITNSHATYKVNDVVYHVATVDGVDVGTSDPSVTAGDAVVLTLDRDGKVTKVGRQTSVSTTTTIQAKNESWTSSGVVKTLTLSDGSVVTIGSGCTFERNGITKGFADLKTGDTVVLGYSDGKVSSVKAYTTVSGLVSAVDSVNGIVTVKDSSGTDIAKIAYVVNYSSLKKNGVQTVVTASTDFAVNSDVKVLSWNFSDADHPYGNFLTRKFDEAGYVFKGIQSELVSGVVNTYLVLRADTTNYFVKVTPGAILNRADAAVAAADLVVGDVVGLKLSNATDGKSVATAWEVTYLNAAGDTTAPTVAKQDPEVSGLTVKYTADEQHIVSYRVYSYATGELVMSGDSAEKASGNNDVTVTGAKITSAPAGTEWTVVLTVKDYAGNTANPLVFKVVKPS